MQPKIIWLEGLSGSGKSTTGDALAARLRQLGHCVVRLDGDHLRKTLCADLGFSAEDRRENLRRAAVVAKQHYQLGNTVIASFITPQQADRQMLRTLLGKAFFEVFIDTPLTLCAQRDPKGLYAKAYAGLIEGFTGVSSPFESPCEPDATLTTHTTSVLDNVHCLISMLNLGGRDMASINMSSLEESKLTGIMNSL